MPVRRSRVKGVLASNIAQYVRDKITAKGRGNDHQVKIKIIKSIFHFFMTIALQFYSNN